MKIIGYILAFYLLILPLAGFAGAAVCDEPGNSEITASADTHSDDDTDEDCSPFCNCACCFHIVSNHFQLQKIAVARIYNSCINYAPYKNTLLPTDPNGNIWQPPKSIV